MPKKYSFPELGCSSCEHLQRVGGVLCETRYCGGFPKRRNPKRFRASDPKVKAPQWCPRRFSKPVCRIYGFADEMSEYMDRCERFVDEKSDDPLRGADYISPPSYRYKLRLELPLGMKAKAFYDEVKDGNIDIVLSDANLQLGEVIEIDDGLKPYYFYCLSWSKLVPVMYFDCARIQKGD